MPSTGVAYVLWALLGGLGVHRFYLGRPFTGLLWALTFGLLGVGLLLDLFLIPGMVRAARRKYVREMSAITGRPIPAGARGPRSFRLSA